MEEEGVDVGGRDGGGRDGGGREEEERERESSNTLLIVQSVTTLEGSSLGGCLMSSNTMVFFGISTA